MPGGEAIAPRVVAPGSALAGSSPRPPDLQRRTWRPGRAESLPALAEPGESEPAAAAPRRKAGCALGEGSRLRCESRRPPGVCPGSLQRLRRSTRSEAAGADCAGATAQPGYKLRSRPGGGAYAKRLVRGRREEARPRCGRQRVELGGKSCRGSYRERKRGGGGTGGGGGVHRDKADALAQLRAAAAPGDCRRKEV